MGHICTCVLIDKNEVVLFAIVKTIIADCKD